jgi:hypothetical protein
VKRTGSAVQVRDVEDISCAADGVAGAAKANLALLNNGGSNGRDSESEDDGELHIDGLGWWLVGWLEEKCCWL